MFSHSVVSNSLWPQRLQHARPPYPSPSPRVCSSSCSLHQWCHPAISSSDAFFSFCPWSFPALGTFPMSHLFASDDQNTGASFTVSSYSVSVNIQGWSPLRSTGLILLSKGLKGVFSSPTVQRHQFCLLYGPAVTTVRDHWKDHSFDYTDFCRQYNASAFQYTL